MDGFRTAPTALDDLFKAVDANTYTIADTIGGRTPAGVVEHLNALRTDLSSVGAHFHDDLGVGTANALAASRAGVDKIDASIAGLGERAGNTALEEFVAAATVGDEPTAVAVENDQLLPAATTILETLDESIASRKPLLGDGVFAHESGLHTAAMLDDPSTFEPFDPAQFGGHRQLLFGAGSGRGAARRLLWRADREVTDERVQRLLDRLEAAEEELTLREAVALAGRVE